MIEVKNLTKQYGNHFAVDDLSFTVEKGQIYGFLGPNGAGKSTTMNIITGYLASSEGTVTVNGHDILEEPEEARRNIGYLPEQPPLYMDMTVCEYLKFVSELKNIPKDQREEMISEIMDSLQLTDMEERLIRNLSKGYRQRVGLAQAIMGYPEVIILDEPTVGLDPKQIMEIRSLIHELGKKHTIILSSHILSEVREICDIVLIISHGRLVACDTPDNLEKISEGYKTLELVIRGERDVVTRELEAIEGVTINTVSEDEMEGAYHITVQTAEAVDLREKIFYQMAEHRLPILGMQQNIRSLEDVFIELTSDDVSEKVSTDSETDNEQVKEGGVQDEGNL